MPDDDKSDGDELIELLNELRVTLPGVQVLFAFLLAVPFSQGWEKVTGAERYAFFASIMCATISTVLLIAPTSYHRLRFRQGDKAQMLKTANRLAIAGTVFLALAMTAAVFLVTEVVFDDLAAALVAGGVAGLFGWFWYGLPLSRRAVD